MIVAIGNDLIELHRLEGVWRREGETFLRRIYTDEERDYCLALANPLPSLGARFAAKEAFQKVWPRPHGWRDVWVVRDPTPQGPFPFSRPYLRFAPDLEAEMHARGWRAHLTLTHTREHAAAVVLLEQVRP
ncbi:holo-[acyl-carrier protein] synthase [Deinobacterium chartae]|uniref:Holo-[acyl-carrier-protein] synthase n=1 Tax=Deinobacterium chartae TaxID=521158 RepID=A0A841HYQ8_9DEIO|nr:4'-phosphopantetheinyl transferase superfamily protein [Deinobacterium chartae]MBB6098527.1 holo-[acyl-carrier protein] synthase [Deinobacterium chartae]